MEDFLEINYDSYSKKKVIKQVKHNNLYDDYFQGTAKLWKDCDSEINLIKITDFGRVFYKNGKISYFEIFEDKRTELIGISKKISLIYAPLEKDNENYDKDRCIGFRYYEEDKLKKCNYFTLIKKYDKRFFILEKSKNILDTNGSMFYDEQLNCYSIMRNIVFEKYKSNKIIIPKGEPFPEIFGFIYSLIYLGKFKGFTVIEPLILEPLNEESRIEKLPENLEDDIGYIEPIIFDNHISVALIKKSKIKIKGRVNIIFDMSRYHVDENLSDNIVFPEELYYSNYPYPEFSIQKGNSCGVWFYGIIESIYSNDKYKNINDVCLAINHKSADFFIDVINCLSFNIYGINNIIDNSSINGSLNIKENRIYEIVRLNTHSFRKEAIMSYFFSLASIFAHYESIKNNYKRLDRNEIIFEYQYLIDDIKEFLSLVIFNDKYFKILSPKDIYIKEQKNEYQALIQKLKELLDKVNQNYEKEFYNLLCEQFKDNLNYGIFNNNKEKIKNAYNKLKNTIDEKKENITIDINKLKREFDDIKYCKRKVAIKEESTIIKYLNPNNEFYFQMMIH